MGKTSPPAESAGESQAGLELVPARLELCSLLNVRKGAIIESQQEKDATPT